MIERDDQDDVAVVRLAHGPVNALDTELLGAIVDTFRILDTSGPAAIVFTGSGRAFSAGVDLWRVLDGGEPYLETFLDLLVTAFETVFTVGKPVVAALNGHAIAGGCIFAAACDHRVMADGAGRIGVPEPLVGVPFPTVALEILEYAYGTPARHAAVLTGATHEPRDALALGLVDEVVPGTGLVAHAVATARRLGTGVPPDTFRVTKRQLHATVDERVARRWPVERPEVLRLWTARAADGWMRDYLQRVTRRADEVRP